MMVIEIDEQFLNDLPPKRLERIKRSMDKLHLDEGALYLRNDRQVRLFGLQEYEVKDIRRFLETLELLHDKTKQSEMDAVLEDEGLFDDDSIRLFMKGYRMGFREAKQIPKHVFSNAATQKDFDNWVATSSLTQRIIRFHNKVPDVLTAVEE